MTAVLGLSCGPHDSAACVVIDGHVVAALAEERLSRIKHDGAFPRRAIAACLDMAGLQPRDLSAVCLAGASEDAEARARQQFAAPLLRVDRHRAHAYSAFPFSGQDRTAVLILDGAEGPDWGTIWSASGNEAILLATLPASQSMAVVYRAVTQFLGFPQHDEEWKVMGWAPYGRPLHKEILAQALFLGDGTINPLYIGRVSEDGAWYSAELPHLLGLQPRPPKDGFAQAYADVAASIQALAEDAVLAAARQARDLTGTRHLCMAGSLALNGRANSRIMEEGLFDSLSIQPAAADDGMALGAALWAAAQGGDNLPRTSAPVYLGSASAEEDCLAALHAWGLSAIKLGEEALCARVAADIAEGKAVGWFQGRSEFGPRALGNRSILADPRRSGTKDILNATIKFREPFRPFAPVVLAEQAEVYFEGDLDGARFMNRIFHARPVAQTTIPAAVHADGTSRVQTVRQEDNPRLHRLLMAFQERTGVAVLVNTSFNVKGEAMAETAEDAVRCFLGTSLEVLVLNDLYVMKQGRTSC